MKFMLMTDRWIIKIDEAHVLGGLYRLDGKSVWQDPRMAGGRASDAAPFSRSPKDAPWLDPPVEAPHSLPSF